MLTCQHMLITELLLSILLVAMLSGQALVILIAIRCVRRLLPKQLQRWKPWMHQQQWQHKMQLGQQ
jgi:hypothetical protein